MKDVLARAAAKGLLDGVEVGKAIKRDKKRKKPKALPPRAPHHGDPLRDHLPVAGNETSSSIQMKISEFLNRESKASSAAKTPLPAKTVPQASTSSQIRKPTKPLSTPLMRNASRAVDKPINLGRPRPEGKVIPLKPVEIVLPPVMFPLSPQGPRFQMPATHFYYRFIGSKVGLPGHLTSIARRKEKAKESIPSSLVRHPRPWL